MSKDPEFVSGRELIERWRLVEVRGSRTAAERYLRYLRETRAIGFVKPSHEVILYPREEVRRIEREGFRPPTPQKRSKSLSAR